MISEIIVDRDNQPTSVYVRKVPVIVSGLEEMQKLKRGLADVASTQSVQRQVTTAHRHYGEKRYLGGLIMDDIISSLGYEFESCVTARSRRRSIVNRVLGL